MNGATQLGLAIETVMEMDQVNVRAMDRIVALLIRMVAMGECSLGVGNEVVRIIQKAAEDRLQLSQDVKR